MMEEIVIIGGGLAGTSLLHALALAGRGALLIEALTIGGGGATAHSRGMLRIYDPSPALTHFAQKGLRFWQDFSGRHPGLLDPCGLAYFAATENLEKLHAFVETDYAVQAKIALVPAEQIHEKCPVLNPRFIEEKRIALWEPQAGSIDPRMAARSLADEAIASGLCAVVEGAAVTRIASDEGGFKVATEFGSIDSQRVIITCGAYAKHLHPKLPIETRSITLSSFTGPADDLPRICIIDEVSESYLRPAHGHFYVGGASPATATIPETLNVDRDAAMKENSHNLGVLLAEKNFRPLSAHAGFDGYSTDYLPLMKQAGPDQVGLFTGFSGRGAKYIPSLAADYVAAGLDGRWL